jgi:hypothetical protein
LTDFRRVTENNYRVSLINDGWFFWALSWHNNIPNLLFLTFMMGDQFYYFSA